MEDFADTIDDMRVQVDEGFEDLDFSVAKDASGMCYAVAEHLAMFYEIDPIYASHDNKAYLGGGESGEKRFNDHWAVFMPEYETVVDFTFRQFDPTAPFPLVATIDDWHDRLKKVWGVENFIHTATGDWYAMMNEAA